MILLNLISIQRNVFKRGGYIEPLLIFWHIHLCDMGGMQDTAFPESFPGFKSCASHGSSNYSFIMFTLLAFCFTCLLVLLLKKERIYHEKFCCLVHIFCIAHILYCTNTLHVLLIIEHLAIASKECFVCWLVLPVRERNNFI